MAVKQLDTVLYPLTKDLADDFATMPCCRGERKLNQDRLQFLKSRLDSGFFYSPDWAVGYYNGAKMRFNGQHSSMMLSRLDENEFPRGMKAVVRIFSCDTAQDCALLFDQFDRPESSRKSAEMIHAHAMAEDEMVEIASACIKIAIPGIAVFHELNGHGRLNMDARAQLVHVDTHKEFIAWFQKFYADKEFRLAAVSAAIHATWIVSPDIAAEFWGLVRDQSHPDNQHPTRVLARFLTETRVASLTKTTNHRRHFSHEHLYTCCGRAWNAYRQGRIVKLLKVLASNGGVIKFI